MRKFRFYVVDFYEGAELVAKATCKHIAWKMLRDYNIDTDGECETFLYDIEIPEEREKLKKLGII